MKTLTEIHKERQLVAEGIEEYLDSNAPSQSKQDRLTILIKLNDEYNLLANKQILDICCNIVK